MCSRPPAGQEGRCLADETGQRVLIGDKVAQQDLTVALWRAVNGKTLEPQPLQDAIATLSAVAPMIQLLPRLGAVGNLARQAHCTVSMSTADRGRVAVLVLGVEIGAVGYRTLGVVVFDKLKQVHPCGF